MTSTGSFTAPDGFTGRDSAASSSVRSGHSSSRRAISNRPMGQARMVRSRRNAMIRSSVPAALASGSSRSRHTRADQRGQRVAVVPARGAGLVEQGQRLAQAGRLPPADRAGSGADQGERQDPARAQQRGAAGDQAAHGVTHQVHAAGLCSAPAGLTESAMASTSAAS